MRKTGLESFTPKIEILCADNKRLSMMMKMMMMIRASSRISRDGCCCLVAQAEKSTL